jgi:TPR repeat protein
MTQNMMLKRCCNLLLAAVFLLAVAGCADHLQAGTSAYKAKNFAAALNELQPLADKGNAEAQLYVGLMYDNGEGVAVDYRQAVLWYTRSAEQGNPTAQYNLGMMYANGLSVPMDGVQALKWFNLAALTGGDPEFANVAKQLSDKLTPEQVKEAWALANEWKAQHK